MRVKISNEVLENPKKSSQIINFICSLNGKHSICTDNIKDIFYSLREDLQIIELLKEKIIKQGNGIDYINSIEVVLSNPKEQQVGFDDFGIFLSKEAVVVLENRLNDTKFLMLILNSKNYKNISNSYGSYWRIESAGGCGQIPVLIEDLLSLGMPKNRLVVIHDSDKLYPQAVLNGINTKIVNKCREHDIKCHTLKKREMENYITDELLFNIYSSDTEFLTAWNNLTKEQKSHFDYKYGFSKKPYSSQEYGGLFCDLPNDCISIIANGFGDDIAQKAYTDGNLDYFKGDKVKLWCHNTEREFKKICEIIESIL